jgi:hypothetical protein
LTYLGEVNGRKWLFSARYGCCKNLMPVCSCRSAEIISTTPITLSEGERRRWPLPQYCHDLRGCVTYERGSGLDDWIYCTLYTVLGTTGSYSAIAILHTFQFTVTHALGFLAFSSRILATALQQSPCHFKSHIKSSFQSLISFSPLFCSCQFLSLDSIQFLCSQAHIPAGWRPETRLFTSRRLFYTAEHFLLTTLNGPRRKHNPYC